MTLEKPRKAMLLAAGRGSRLRPLTDEIPKCMVSVAGKPVLQHNLEWLRSFGIREFMINLCHLPECVVDHFKDGRMWDVNIEYSFEEEQLGTAGGVKRAQWFFDEPFVVWYGDNLSTCRIDLLWKFHQNKGSLATIALHRRENPTSSGIAEFDRNQRIVRFLEKPTPGEVFSNWVSAGIFVLQSSILDRIPEDTPVDFGKDIFPALLQDNETLYAYPFSKGEKLWWIDTREDFDRVGKLFTKEYSRVFSRS